MRQQLRNPQFGQLLIWFVLQFRDISALRKFDGLNSEVGYHARVEVARKVIELFQDILVDVEFDGDAPKSIVFIDDILYVLLFKFGKDFVEERVILSEFFFLRLPHAFIPFQVQWHIVVQIDFKAYLIVLLLLGLVIGARKHIEQEHYSVR